jgi:hypothetical protein
LLTLIILAVLVKLLKKMETGRTNEPESFTENAYAKPYLPRTYSASSTRSDPSPSPSPSPPASAPVQRATSADITAKRNRIANIIREAEEEEINNREDGDDSTATMVGRSMQSNRKPPPQQHLSSIHQLSTQSLHQPQLQPQPQSQPQPHQPQNHQPIPSKREAFEKFKHQHPDYAPSLENHAVLKDKYQVAKEYSELVNQSREKISMVHPLLLFFIPFPLITHSNLHYSYLYFQMAIKH